MVREYMKHNRRTVINNTDVTSVTPSLIKELYKVMDRKKATECYINMALSNYLEVDLFAANGECVGYAIPVYGKED